MLMTELDELKTGLSEIRDLLRMADSDTMVTRELLKAQASLLEVLRSMPSPATASSSRQDPLGGMLVAMEKQGLRVSSVDRHVLELTTDTRKGMAGVDTRLTGVETRLDGMDKNIVAIMRHLGI
jgi:hypothetical protein